MPSFAGGGTSKKSRLCNGASVAHLGLSGARHELPIERVGLGSGIGGLAKGGCMKTARGGMQRLVGALGRIHKGTGLSRSAPPQLPGRAKPLRVAW